MLVVMGWATGRPAIAVPSHAVQSCKKVDHGADAPNFELIH